MSKEDLRYNLEGEQQHQPQGPVVPEPASGGGIPGEQAPHGGGINKPELHPPQGEAPIDSSDAEVSPNPAYVEKLDPEVLAGVRWYARGSRDRREVTERARRDPVLRTYLRSPTSVAVSLTSSTPWSFGDQPPTDSEYVRDVDPEVLEGIALYRRDHASILVDLGWQEAWKCAEIREYFRWLSWSARSHRTVPEARLRNSGAAVE